MHRRALIAAGFATLGTPACDQTGPAEPMNGPAGPETPQPGFPAKNGAQTYTREEIVNNVSDFLGVTAESAGAEVTSLREERDQIKSRVTDMLKQLDGLNL